MITLLSQVTNRKSRASSLAAMLIGASLAGCQTKGSAPVSTAVQAKPVEVATATLSHEPELASISGSIAAYRESTVSSQVGDKITAWPLKVGDSVRAGQLIARLDSQVIQAQISQAEGQARQAEAEVTRLRAEYNRASQETLAGIRLATAGVRAAEANRVKVNSFTRSQELRQAEAKLAQANADAVLATKELARFQRLYDSGAASRQTLDQVQAKFDVVRQEKIAAEQGVSLAKEGARAEDRAAAGAKVDEARANLMTAESRPARLDAIRSGIDAAKAQAISAWARVREARAQLSRFSVTAPFAGRVLRTQGELGQMASPGSPLITLGETARVKLLFSVPEADRLAIKEATVPFTIESLPGRKFTARITSRGYQADLRTRNFPFEAVVENPGELLLPGMVARITVVQSGQRAGLEIPVDALVMDGTEARVFVAEGGRASTRRILIEARNGSRVRVKDGLRVGDKVVVNPKGLAEGQLVQEVVR